MRLEPCARTFVYFSRLWVYRELGSAFFSAPIVHHFNMLLQDVGTFLDAQRIRRCRTLLLPPLHIVTCFIFFPLTWIVSRERRDLGLAPLELTTGW